MISIIIYIIIQNLIIITYNYTNCITYIDRKTNIIELYCHMDHTNQKNFQISICILKLIIEISKFSTFLKNCI